MRPSAPNQSSGFTLIEVLVSLAIFALAAVVLAGAYLNIIGSYRAMGSRHQAEEDWKWLRSVVLAESEKEIVEQGGNLPLAEGRLVVWSATIEATGVADLFQLTVEAEATGSGSQDSWKRRESFNLLRPAWSDPAERERLREKTRKRVEQENGL